MSEKESIRFIVEDEEMQSLRDEFKIPFACPACNKLMENWDDKSFFKFGVCCKCEINYIESRKIDDSILKNRKALLNYVKEMIEENKNRKRQ